jgi:hypothetical protein
MSAVAYYAGHADPDFVGAAFVRWIRHFGPTADCFKTRREARNLM